MTDPAPRVAIVTGSESGIGRATAVALAEAGCDLGITWYREREAAEATAEEVRARIGRWARVEDEGPGRSRVRMAADGLDWPAFAIGTLGAEVTVVAPPELVDLLHEWGRRFGRAACVVPPDEHGDRPTEGRSP